MNRFTCIGRITKDIELKYTASQTAVARFSVALDRGKDKDGNDRGADFPTCIAFGRTAENLERFSGKGLRIAIEGHIQTDSYEKDGGKIYTTDIICDKVEFVDWKQNGQKAASHDDAPAGFSSIDEEIPF